MYVKNKKRKLNLEFGKVKICTWIFIYTNDLLL